MSVPFLRFVSKTGKQKDRQPPWKGGESGAACLYGELLNICGCQEGFGSLSAASGYCLAWVGDSVLKGPRLRRSFLPAFAGFGRSSLGVVLPDCTLIVPDKNGVSLWGF